MHSPHELDQGTACSTQNPHDACKCNNVSQGLGILRGCCSQDLITKPLLIRGREEMSHRDVFHAAHTVCNNNGGLIELLALHLCQVRQNQHPPTGLCLTHHLCTKQPVIFSAKTCLSTALVSQDTTFFIRHLPYRLAGISGSLIKDA